MKRIVLLIAAIAVCIGIFLVTKSPAATGGNTYELIADKLPVSPDQVPWLNYLFRKGAHLLTFGSLAVLLALILPKRPYLFAWFLVTVYAATDEWHQYHVPGRTGSVMDVILDSCGALIGLGILYLVKRKRGVRQ